MPIYGFHCEDCGKEFETLVRSSETPICPSCESANLTRLLSLIAQPSRGGDAGDFGSVSDGPAPACGSGACCFGGGCG